MGSGTIINGVKQRKEKEKMYEIGKIIILTQQEYDEIEEKARRVIDERNNTKKLNMRLRFPYYAVSPEDVETHQDLPMSDVLPYYVYLTCQDENGEYLVEPGDELFEETRDYMKEIYDSRILVAENEEEEQRLIDRIEQGIKDNNTQE